jgi:hypothetical protein
VYINAAILHVSRSGTRSQWTLTNAFQLCLVWIVQSRSEFSRVVSISQNFYSLRSTQMTSANRSIARRPGIKVRFMTHAER